MRWLVFLGAIVVLGGFVLGEKAYRNAFVHGLVNLVDPKDDACQEATVAMGSSCPAGCVAKPAAGPEEMRRIPECRSRLWVATCGEECDARPGLLRDEEGGFVETDAFILTLTEPPEGYKDEFAIIGITLKPMASGLWRYRAMYGNPENSMRELEKMEERIKALTYVKSLERIRK